MYEEYPEDLQKVIAFHGHMCPGLAIGYRAAQAAIARLEAERPEDEELVTVVETDACSIDAIQVILGCTMGKGNLLFRDHGKQVFTVFCRERNQAYRIALAANILERAHEQEALMKRVFAGDATEQEKESFKAFQRERVERILGMNEESLFKIEQVTPDIPAKARIFKTVTCNFCGELVMEPRARIREGKPTCIACAENYAR
jgi:formylmethanofuran dehydrogenase subunit E